MQHPNLRPSRQLALGVIFALTAYGQVGGALATDLSGGSVASIPASTASKINASGLGAQATVRRFIIDYRAGSAAKAAPASMVQTAISHSGVKLTSAASLHATPLSATFRRNLATGQQLVELSHTVNASQASAIMLQLAAQPDVLHVEPDVLLRATRDIRADVTPVVPNDPYYATYQWDFHAGDGQAETVGSDTTAYPNFGGVNASKAWGISNGSGVVVAVLDTGITAHPDLDTSLAATSYDMITDAFVSGRSTDDRVKGAWDLGDWTTGDTYLTANGGCIDDEADAETSSWHGTHVAGNVAETTNNAVGFSGVAYGAKVLPVRVLGHCGGYTSDIADAIVWSSGGHVDGLDDNATPAQVISMSLGGTGQCTASSVTGQAIATARANGATVVVAAGNDGVDASTESPSGCPGVITVASNGISGKPAFYSNYGSVVTVSAPGGGVYAGDATSGSTVAAGFVWSTINSGDTVPVSGTYGGMAGTSQATPHVSAVVALILSATKSAGLATPTPDQIKDLLTTTARPFPVTPTVAYGAGIVDAYAATAKAIGAGGDTGGASTVTALTKNVPLQAKAGDTGATHVYSIVVPAAARSLVIRTYGANATVGLLVKKDSAPAANGSDASYKSSKPGATQSVTIPVAAAGTYYLTVTGITPSTSYSVLATYSLQ